MKRPLVIRVHSDVNGEPRVQIRAGNGRILLSSEAYEGGADKARHAIAVLVAQIRDGNYRLEHGAGDNQG